MKLPIFLLILIIFSGCANIYANKPYVQDSNISSNVLVIYYSRSGNTETMAFEIAKTFNAKVIKLKTESYSLNFWGWVEASWDSLWNNNVQIEPTKIDFSGYKLIFLGSPVWYWDVANPIKTFIEKNSFKGTSVVIFLTMESGYREKAIANQGKKIEKSKGKYLGHIFIKRKGGSGEEIIKEAQKIIERHIHEWEKY